MSSITLQTLRDTDWPRKGKRLLCECESHLFNPALDRNYFTGACSRGDTYDFCHMLGISQYTTVLLYIFIFSKFSYSIDLRNLFPPPYPLHVDGQCHYFWLRYSKQPQETFSWTRAVFLTLKLICCPQPQALGNRPVFKSNSTAVVLKHDVEITMNNIENISAQLYIDEI